MNPDHFPVTRDDVVVNLGAHQGRLTLHYAAKARRVISVEPVKENYDRLIDAVKATGLSNVTLHRAAIGSETHKGVINIGTNSENHSTVRRFGGETRPVLIYSWDDLVTLIGEPRIRLAKVDVEGSEVEWLQGMTHTYPDCVIVEEHSRFGFYTLDRLLTQLKAKGYTCTVEGLNVYGRREV